MQTIKQVIEKLPRLSYVCVLKNTIFQNKNSSEELITYLRSFIDQALSSGLYRSQPISLADLNRVYANELMDQATFPLEA
jgi:hypothetical protein